MSKKEEQVTVQNAPRKRRKPAGSKTKQQSDREKRREKRERAKQKEEKKEAEKAAKQQEKAEKAARQQEKAIEKEAEKAAEKAEREAKKAEKRNKKKEESKPEKPKKEEKTTKSSNTRRRYKGYDVQEVAKKHPQKEGNWFWKTLVISVVISIFILIAIVVAFYLYSKKQTDYISRINESNSLETLLDGETNLQVTQTYSNTADGNDYTAIRQVRLDDDGEYFSYYKTEGLVTDIKEVIADNEVYQSDGSYTYYYAMVGDDYDDKLQEISDDIFSVYDDEKIEEQTESSDTVTIVTNYSVQSGDKYTQIFGCSAGDTIKREIIMDKETSKVTAVKETYNDELIYTYSLEQSVENKTPKFYQAVQKAKTTRKCSVYYDYGGDGETSYSYDVPEDVYFTLLDHDGYTVYMDTDEQKEFGEYEMQTQSLTNVLTLYMVKDSDSDSTTEE